jgi:PKHD-type hydroxylase
MIPTTLLSQPKRQMEPFVFYKDWFTPAECDAIIHLAKGLPPRSAEIGGPVDRQVNKEVRSSVLRWLPSNEQSAWIFERLAKLCHDVRANWYPFNLSGFDEAIQITEYLASEGGHYDTHQDFGSGDISTRKLSLVMLLNDPAEFKGGELELLSIPGEDKVVKQVGQGTVIAFPSWELHRVRKITEGQRWSLVNWVHGPAFV